MRAIFSLVLVVFCGCSMFKTSPKFADEALLEAHALLKENTKESLKAAAELAVRASELEHSNPRVLEQCLSILYAVEDSRAETMAGRLNEITVLGNFFAMPTGEYAPPLEVAGSMTFSNPNDWLGVKFDKNHCQIITPKIALVKDTSGGSDGQELIDVTRVELFPKETLFVFKKNFSLTKTLECAELRDEMALLKDKRYVIELPKDYLTGDGVDCLPERVTPIKVFDGDKMESTWVVNACELDRHGLNDGVVSTAWAGFLDEDQKLDLMVKMPSHPMGATYLLLLSSDTSTKRVFSYSHPNNPGC